jgi:hypothetical protein
MHDRHSSHDVVCPLRIFVAHRSPAEKRAYAMASMPEPKAIAPGIKPTPAHDLVFHGGHTITDLAFWNFYVGGSDAWKASDIQDIDRALAAAMNDVKLNNVMSQYYPSGKITSKFNSSKTLASPKPSVVSQGDVEALLLQLFHGGALEGADFSSTVFNFMLPSGTILNTNASPTGGTITARVERPGVTRQPEEAEDSLQGLGGYHGSIHAGTGSKAEIVYYAIGAFSEKMPDGRTNGIPVFDQSWKNVVATFYHELNEARTDPDVEDAIRAGNDPSATQFLGWTSQQGEECGDFPVFEADPLTKVFQEVQLADGSGTVPVQFQYSDAVHGPEGPRDTAAPYAGAASKAGAMRQAGAKKKRA